jgi:hypothetical protein
VLVVTDEWTIAKGVEMVIFAPMKTHESNQTAGEGAKSAIADQQEKAT